MSKLDDVLAQFAGKTADEIAETVRRRGIKGRMGTTYGCPMALLLGGTQSGQYVIGRKYIVRRSGGKLEQARTPRPVMEFVRKFDIGDYPGLVAPPPRCLRNAGSPKRPVRKGPKPSGKKKAIKHHIAKLVNRFEE